MTRNDELREYYKELNSRGLCQTEREFSTDWLGRASNYMSTWHINQSPRVLLILIERLRERGQHDLVARAMADLFAKGAA